VKGYPCPIREPDRRAGTYRKGRGGSVPTRRSRAVVTGGAVHPQPETYWGHVNPVGLGWEPRAPLDEGLKTTISWIRDAVGGGQDGRPGEG